MNNASTPDGRGQERPNDAKLFFPSEGTFNTVVPLAEVDGRPVPAPPAPIDPADVGKPAEADWAREAHRAGRGEEEEATLVPARPSDARGGRPSWAVAAGVITLSVAAGLASGTYLIWSSHRAPAPQPPARVAAEAPTLAPAPVTDAMPPAPAAAAEGAAVAKVEREEEAAGGEKPGEAAKAERSDEAAPATKQARPPQPAPRAERVARAADEPREAAPAPKPTRTQSAPSPRPRTTTAERRQPAPSPSERALPISSPPSPAGSKKVIQWP